MIATSSHDDLRTPSPIEAALAAHGAWAVLFAAASALLRGRMRKARPPDIAGLGNWMRADIGLPPQPHQPDWRRHGHAGLIR